MAQSRRACALLAAVAVVTIAACGGRGDPRVPLVPRREPPVCPHDAVVMGGACRCAPGLSVLEGACVGQREVDAYCGPRPGGVPACAIPMCASGDALDLSTRGCAPARRAREIVARARPVPDDLVLGCHEGRTLVVEGDEVACLPLADVCPRGTDWDATGGRCAPVAACAPGEVRGENGERGRGCIRVVTRASQGAPVVDVGEWSRAMLGGDGGNGTSRLCRPLAQRPWALDVGPGGARTLPLTIELRFPDNDVTQLSGTVEAADAPSGKAERAAQEALDALLAPLRTLGGASDAASATVHLRCTIRGGGTPALFPR